MPPEEIYLTAFDNPLIPHVPTDRQTDFLLLDCLDALYGGAAGGGKSDALLMAALQYADVPGYAALILRRKLTDLKKPGALIDRSIEWLKGRAHWNATENRWRFPRGGTLQFGFLSALGDEQQYRSAEFQYIGLDEATQFHPAQIRFMFSRLRRRVTLHVPLRFRLASNPGGVAHEFIKKRYIKPGEPGRAFVPARLADNPYLDAEQYLASLAELDPLTRAQLLAGDWDAVPGGRFNAKWWRYYRRDGDFVTTDDGERFLPQHRPRFQTCDPAASTSTAADYFVLSTWLVTPEAKLLWWGCHREKLEIEDQVAVCKRLYRHYRPELVAVEVIGNFRALKDILARSTDPLINVIELHPAGRSKLERAFGSINLVASGRVLLPDDDPAFPLEEVISETSRFTGLDDREASDIVDTLAYAVRLLPSVSTSSAATGGGPVPIPAPAPGSWLNAKPGQAPPAAPGQAPRPGPGAGPGRPGVAWQHPPPNPGMRPPGFR